MNASYLEEVLGLKTDYINWPLRINDYLYEYKIFLLIDLVKKSSKELSGIRSFGKKRLIKIEKILGELNLALEMKFSAEYEARIRKNKKSFSKFLNAYPDKASLFLDIRINKHEVFSATKEFYKHCYRSYKINKKFSLVSAQTGLPKEKIWEVLVRGARLGIIPHCEHPLHTQYIQVLNSTMTKLKKINRRKDIIKPLEQRKLY